MTNWSVIHNRITFAALIILAIGIFTSVTITAGSHILFLISGSYALFQYIKKPTFKIPASTYALAALIVACLISVITNHDIINEPFRNALKTKYFIIGILSMFAIKRAGEDFLTTKRTKFLVNLFLFTTTVATISGLIALYTGFNPLKMKDACHENRACGLYGMYMTYGYGLSLFMVIAIGLVLYKDELKDYFSYKLAVLAVLVNGLGLFFSFTRGAWIGLLAAVPFFFFKNNKKKFGLVILLSFLSLGTAILVNDKAKDAFFNRWGSNDQRLAFYETALVAFTEKPIFGWGFRNFEANSKMLKVKHKIKWVYVGGHAHNNFLEHLASTGIIGALCFFIFCFLWLLENYRRDDPIGKIKFPFIVSFLVAGMVQYTFGDGENLFLIMIAYGII